MSTPLPPGVRQALLDAFADRASDVPEFTATALTGGHRPDEGLRNLLPPDWTLYEQRCEFKRAVVAQLQAGGPISQEHARGDIEMALDAAEYIHLRVHVADVALFAKIAVDEYRGEYAFTVVSVKRDDQAWTG